MTCGIYQITGVLFKELNFLDLQKREKEVENGYCLVVSDAKPWGQNQVTNDENYLAIY